MNIQERNQYIGLHNQLVDLGNLNNSSTSEFINANKYWDNLSRPPLYQYIPQYVFTKLHEYFNNKRLYNRPKERFKLVNELLEPIGLKPLASGTNRRTFYCTYDPNIVFKLASDHVGMSDNLNEFTMQKLLKPFFAKMFSVTPDGLMSLSERVETMTEKDYKIIWSEYIFQIINDLLSRGYIMEDIGSNFFRNWGIRIGYGPVLLDCPYIYKVDRSKLKCPRINKRTGEICNGDIDYNYEKGMSEIICTKCGTRYYASELAEIYPSESFTKIVKGRDYRMGTIDTNVKVQITKGDQVVNRYFIETDSQEFSNNQGPRRVTVDDFNPTVQTFPHVQTNIHSVVTNVTHNIPIPENSNYNINDNSISYNLFNIDIPNTLLNTIKTNCNIDLTKLSENELYNCFTKNTTPEFWISHMSQDEYKIFSDYASKFISNYLSKSSFGNGDPLINIFGSYIYKSVIFKIEKALNIRFDMIPDVNVLYNKLIEDKNNSIIRSALNEKEYNAFKIFIGTLAAINIDKITFINSQIPSFTLDLVKLCDKPISKSLYQKLETITNLQFSKIEDNISLTKYLVESEEQISKYLTGEDLAQFKFFVLSISSEQKTIELQNTPQITEGQKFDVPAFEIIEPAQKQELIQQPEPAQVEQKEEPEVQITPEEEQKELEKIVTEEQPKQEEVLDNVDEYGNTIGVIEDWAEYYRDHIKYTLYPKDVKNEIIYFLKIVERKFGYPTAEILSNKLQIKYIKLDEYNKDINQKTLKAVFHKTKRTIVRPQESQEEQSKNSSKYSIPTQTEPSPQKMINPELDWKTRDKEVEIEKTVEIDPNKEYFVEKAKTSDELAKLAEEKLQSANTIVGVIGEPKVDSLRNKELIPILKDKLFLKFNNIELEPDVDIQMKDLQKYIKKYIFDEMKLITRDDGSGIDVEILRSADERNRDCFKIYVKNNNAVLFEVVIYPKKDDFETDKRTVREKFNAIQENNDIDFDVHEFLTNETKLYEFLNQKINEYDCTKLSSVEEAQKVLTSYLYSVLFDHVQGKASSPLIMRICKDYVINQCKISDNNVEEIKEQAPIVEEEPAFTPADNSSEESENTIADQI